MMVCPSHNSQFRFFVLFSAILTSCGSDSRTDPDNIVNPNQVITEPCKDQLARTHQDTDGDGISDYDEVYGWQVLVDLAPMIVFTNPLAKDTDGDGRNDFDEQGTISIHGRSEILRGSVATHPAHRDWALRVYSGTYYLNGQPSNDFTSGWNVFESITPRGNDVFSVRDLRTDQWSSTIGSSTATGFTSVLNCSDTVRTCTASNQDSLIAKWSTSKDPQDLASYPFDLGSRLSTRDFSYERSISTEMKDRVLMLRSNSNDGSDLSNRRGFITAVVRLKSPQDRPQRAPSAAEEEALFSQLCK